MAAAVLLNRKLCRFFLSEIWWCKSTGKVHSYYIWFCFTTTVDCILLFRLLNWPVILSTLASMASVTCCGFHELFWTFWTRMTAPLCWKMGHQVRKRLIWQTLSPPVRIPKAVWWYGLRNMILGWYEICHVMFCLSHDTGFRQQWSKYMHLGWKWVYN